MTTLFSIIADAFERTKADQQGVVPRLRDKWIRGSAWVKALNALGYVNHTQEVKVGDFNRAMARSNKYGDLMVRFDGSNHSGIFKVVYRREQFYYVCTQAEQTPAYPPMSRKAEAKLWFDSVVKAESRAFRESSEDEEEESEDDTETQAAKRQRTQRTVHITPASIANQSYWENEVAERCFGKKDDDDSVQDAIERRISILRSANETVEGWRHVVVGRDPDNLCSSHDIHAIRQKSQLLCLAYSVALEKIETNKVTWEACCKEACVSLNAIGNIRATNYRTLSDYNIEFRSGEAFEHPNRAVMCGKKHVPSIFQAYPEAKQALIAFCLANLKRLSLEVVRDHLRTVIIPHLFEVWNVDQQQYEMDNELTVDDFLERHGLKNVSIPTCCRYMKFLGFTYQEKRKSYYVDGHERSDVIADRNKFCRRYLTEYEPRCLRWIQVKAEEAVDINGELIKFGYRYLDDEDATSMVEFHVDDVAGQEHLSTIPAKMSVRAPENSRPLMIHGQDEVLFFQYLLGQKFWVGPNQERPLLPKSEGDGFMLSAFQSRDYDFGRPMTQEELIRVNQTREGRHYIDKQAAMVVHKRTTKTPLAESPFVRHFLIGSNNDGWWNSMHMAIQTEDMADCLRVLYPEFDHLGLFDHSQGHDKKREGALDANAMNVNFGGKQPIMRDTVVQLTDLGQYNPLLTIGDTQSMVFREGDDGPLVGVDGERTTQASRDLIKHDRPTGQWKEVTKTVAVLRAELVQVGVDFLRENPKMTRLKEIAKDKNIPLKHHVEIIDNGWLGKPKGLHQVLLERGLIDINRIKEYSKEGKKTPTGARDLSTSLIHLISGCSDFKNEENALQALGRECGILVDCTPKFHAELAGEGIEYTWAFMKGKYRRAPLEQKRTRDKFKALVRECSSAEKVPKEQVRKFAARSRAYICTYFALSQAPVDDNETQEFRPQLYKEIERLSKKFRGHRCALDFDRGFVEGSLKEEVET